MLGVVRAAALFYPRLNGAQARGGARGHGPPPVGKQHGLYLVDVGDGEHRPVSTLCVTWIMVCE